MANVQKVSTYSITNLTEEEYKNYVAYLEQKVQANTATPTETNTLSVLKTNL